MITFQDFVISKEPNFFENKEYGFSKFNKSLRGVNFSDPKVAAELDKQDKERTERFVASNIEARKKLLDSIGKKKNKKK